MHTLFTLNFKFISVGFTLGNIPGCIVPWGFFISLINFCAESYSSFSVISHFLPNPGRILSGLTLTSCNSLDVNPARILSELTLTGCNPLDVNTGRKLQDLAGNGEL